MSDCTKTVCIVEDDADVRDSLNAVMMSMGFSCRLFDSAEMLLDQNDVSECGFLVIDVDLPGMKGTELLAKLREMGTETPAVFYTGRIDQRILDAAVMLGDVPVYQKGTDIKKLMERISNALTKDNEPQD